MWWRKEIGMSISALDEVFLLRLWGILGAFFSSSMAQWACGKTFQDVFTSFIAILNRGYGWIWIYGVHQLH